MRIFNMMINSYDLYVSKVRMGSMSSLWDCSSDFLRLAAERSIYTTRVTFIASVHGFQNSSIPLSYCHPVQSGVVKPHVSAKP